VSKSKFMSDAEEMKDKLGNAMCLAKWQQVSLHLGTGMTNSCYHPPLHEIDAKPLVFNPGALHNTAHKKLQRKLMLEQTRPDECSYCWNAEDNNQLSDRHYRSGEPWAAEHFDTIMKSSWDTDVIPSYVEVNFSNVCNLACSYCSPQYSTKWQVQSETLGPYPTSTPHNDPLHFTGRRKSIPVREENPYVDAFWKWWPELYPKLKHFRMTGGEPLMDKNTHRVFDYILALPKSDLHVDVTSNFSVEHSLFIKYLDKVKQLCEGERIEHFMQYVSLDTGDAYHASYIRKYLNTSKQNIYIHEYLTQVPSRNSLTFIVTMNNLSLLGLKELLDKILYLRKKYSKTYQRVWFDTPLLRTPSWQSLQILPESYTRILEDAISYMKLYKMPDDSFVGFKDYEIQRMERNLEWMKQGSTLDKTYLTNQRADFYRFFNEQDKRYINEANFMETFPEMKEFWKECKWHAENN
jgi:organic radical activating enzyme